MIRTFIECEKCKQNVSKSNFNRHIKKCNGILDYWAKKKLGILEIDNSTVCKFCNKVNKNSNSNRNHQRLCKSNPDKQYTFIEQNKDIFKKGNPYGNRFKFNRSNQYIKAKELGLPKPILSKESRYKISLKSKNRSEELNKKIGSKVSETVSKKMLEGSWHTYGNGKFNKKYIYNGILFDSSWEMKYAMWLDCSDIKWERCKNRFSYVFDDRRKNYIPDFYLPDTKEYIEIKGFTTDRDLAKWEQFPKELKLTILMEKELKDKGVI
jgi:hypothetical protein